MMDPFGCFSSISICPGTRNFKNCSGVKSDLTQPFKPPSRKKLILKISLKSIEKQPNGSIICIPGPKVWMAFINKS